MRGSRLDSGGDWVTNGRQALGLQADHYRAALTLAKDLSRSPARTQVDFTGHSLGGGLAAAAAIATGRPADTFNAAGLHRETIGSAEAIRTSAGILTWASVQACHVRGEILSLAQDGLDRALGGILGGPAGAVIVDAPPAYGQRHTLNPVAPEGKNWFERNVPFDRHGIDWVLSSLPR